MHYGDGGVFNYGGENTDANAPQPISQCLKYLPLIRLYNFLQTVLKKNLGT